MSANLAEATRPEAPLSIFQIPGCHFSDVGLDIEPGMRFDQWERLVRSLERAEQGIQWYLGDALNYGEMEYGEKYAQVIDAHEKTGIPIQTLKSYQWVAGRIPKVRRLTSASWSVHQEVAPLKPAKQIEVLNKVASGEIKPQQRAVRREAHKYKEKRKSEIEVLKSAEVVKWLTSLNKALLAHEETVPATAPFLKNMIRSMLGMVLWQSDRTVEGDCAVIFEAIEAVDGITDDELFIALQDKGFFMRDPEIDDRIELMVEKKRIKWIKMGGRKDNQRGDMADFLVPYSRPVFD